MESLDIKFEKAIRLLSKFAPVSSVDARKPLLPHDVRVGAYLYERGYSDDIVIAGILHDALEFTQITDDMIRDEFGDTIAKLVAANSKNMSVSKDDRNEEMIKRCAQSGQDALIIKAADTIDSTKYYTKVDNHDQLENHCKVVAGLILKYKRDDFDDPIFNELKNLSLS